MIYKVNRRHNLNCTNLIEMIAEFASLKFQLRACLHGDRSYYTESDEMLSEFPENIDGMLTKMIAGEIQDRCFMADDGHCPGYDPNAENIVKISVEEAEFIREFSMLVRNKIEVVSSSSMGKIPQEEIIFHDPVWLEIRQVARGTLKKLNFDLKKWEDECVPAIPENSPHKKVLEEDRLTI